MYHCLKYVQYVTIMHIYLDISAYIHNFIFTKAFQKLQNDYMYFQCIYKGVASFVKKGLNLHLEGGLF